MKLRRLALPALACISFIACAARAPSPASSTSTAPKAAPASLARADETHLADVRRLTFGGENAEAYWSSDGSQLIFQARGGDTGQECDRIYAMKIADDPPKPRPISSGKGATTCSYFLPGDREVIYASTHLAGEACPPHPDHSKGYVWALHPGYDIFRASADGSNVRRLTETSGYDAEGTVCAKDGSIVFTSVRDGDLDLYRMDADGKNVKRLTSTPGYDGGAFFNADCTKITWRASRPKEGPELDEFRQLLSQNLVRPTKLEIYVAEIGQDGLSEVRQLTYLDAASFAPFWHPSQKRVLFSSNYGSKSGREFDIWAIDVQGTRLERVTSAPGFDGFPMFSPDGKLLAFSSNRTTAEGKHDTDVFLARWVDAPPAFAESAADRILADVAWLADPAREGRGPGTKGLDDAGAMIERRMQALGLEAAGEGSSFRQRVPVTTGVRVEPATSVTFGATKLAAADFAPFAFSASGKASGAVVFAGYGIVAKDLGVDDYARLDVKDKVVLVRRYVPENDHFASDAAKRRYGDVRFKAWIARERGARALVVVDLPEVARGAEMPQEASLPSPHAESADDAQIPVVAITRAAGQPLLDRARRGERVQAELEIAMTRVQADAFNVVGRLRARAADKQDGVVVIGAHYDHLGMGGRDSLAPGVRAPHLGADDNASGTATVLEIARALAAHPEKLRRDVVFAAFSGEEEGDVGSTLFTRTPPAGLAMKDVAAMINLDMVGRLRQNALSVLGGESAAEWPAIVQPACDSAHVTCTVSGDGYGPSDHTPFYAAGVPVLFLFTGAHGDYHKPSDAPETINAAGAAQVARIVEDVATTVSVRGERLTYKATQGPPPAGDVRHSHASLGTVPDYSGAATPVKGMLIAGVRAGGAAEQAGIARGDVLVKLGAHDIASVEDLMYALDAYKPGDTMKAIVYRDGKTIEVTVTLQQARAVH